jgi:predicted PurR-regulated permease PerM
VIRTSSGRAVETDSSSHGSGSGWAISVIAVGVVIAILYWARIVFITAMTAVIIALILEPFVSLLTRWRFPRSVATLVVCALAVTVLYFAGLGAWNQLSTIVSDVPALKQNLATMIEGVAGRVQYLEQSAARVLSPTRKSEPPAPMPLSAAKKNNKKAPAPVGPPQNPPGFIPEVRIHEDNPISTLIYGQLGTLYHYALMVSFVPLLVYFMLSWRDHIYRSFLLFFDGPARLTAARSVQGIAGMARAFVVGNFMIGVILSVLSWSLFTAIRLPYPFLIGILSGFLSLIPYAGIVLSLLPPVLAVLATGTPSSVLVFAVMLAVGMHLLAMNVLYPTLVGARVHLNPLIVTFSLMFWAFLWDAAGLVLAIPLTAGLKAVCDNVAGLRKYGRFLGD